MKAVVIAIVVLIAAISGATYALVRGSMAALDGEQSLAGLEAVVSVSRDDLGVVTIRGEGRADVARALGFVHAQDRFFQMDLMRRDAAGELAALAGPDAVQRDRKRRLHQLRRIARQVVSRASEQERAILAAYTDGVNEGLSALAVRPFEYLLLRGTPVPWRPEDTILCIFAMYFQLTDEDGARDSAVTRLHDSLSPALFRFLTVPGTDWDAPLVGPVTAAVPVPGPGSCDLREASPTRRWSPGEGVASFREEDEVAVGSNGWAVGASYSASGKAILADDMHLGLRVPNTWYRARLMVNDPAQSRPSLDVTGATLPGTPAVIVGSNGRIAWGFTNSYGDWTDRVLLDLDPGAPHRYRTPGGYREFGEAEERIEVRGGAPVVLRVRTTIWGPVIGEDYRGRLLALRWIAHAPEATNLNLMRLEGARDVHAAIRIAHRTGMPPQNLVVADAHGNIAWTIMGRIPVRAGYDSRLTVSWATGERGWRGWLPPDRYPVIVNPPQGRIWTANARVVDGAMLDLIGDGGYHLGVRAGQIRDGLMTRDKATIADMLAIQLDARSRLKQRWGELMLSSLGPQAVSRDPRRAALRRALKQWDGRASTDSVAHRLVHDFRLWVYEEVLSAVIAQCGDEQIELPRQRMNQLEGPLWQLVSARPTHLLPPGYESWNALLDAGIDAALASCGREPVDACTWGKSNRVHIAHPLTRALPALGAWLNVQDGPLPGDVHAPRVQRLATGASQRFAVSPGDERNGYFHMPGGQSGHPLSSFYRAGHDAWVAGEATPFLPGPAKHSLTLHP